ncbi:hypothetical protein BH23BAC2_BH23BAC2_11320 [soil metagenome]
MIKIILIIIGFLNPQEKEAFEHYSTSINVLYQEVGATVTDRFPILQAALGDEKPNFVIVVEFPNEQALQNLFSSEKYQSLIPAREKAFKKINVFISTR